jgi:electron transport complex protein RnfC
MFLQPNFIVQAVKAEQWDKAELWGALDCFECGCCSFTCPAYIPHVTYVRKAKADIAALKRR